MIRLAALALGLVAYILVVSNTWGEQGDANIGAGLLAFLLIAGAAFGWAMLDSRRFGSQPAIATWAIVAGGSSACWLAAVGWQAVGAEPSASAGELVGIVLFFIPFTYALVFVPAAAGAAMGQALRRN